LNSLSAIAAALLAAQSAPASVTQAPATPSLVAAASVRAPATLAAGTPLVVTLDQDLTTSANKVGDIFLVTVAHDVVDGATVVIPQGTVGHGEVTFVTRRGGFGKGGIIGIALRDIELDGREILLDGHYREEGKSRTGATAATFFAVGVFSGFIKGNESGIPKGRELRARTGQDVAYTPASSAPPAPIRITAPALSAGGTPVAPASTPSITTSSHH
jgi:hypothetical protein